MISIPKAWGMSAQQHEHLAQTVRQEGHCLLPKVLPKTLIASWYDRFLPLLHDHLERQTRSAVQENRGTNRHYITLPFIAPFADPSVFADPDILAVVDRLVGPDTAMCQLATDTPLQDSDYQELHRDAPPLFPEWGQETPPFQLAVNVPLVAVTQDNGPLETTRGTHLLPKEEALSRIRSGAISLERITMDVGDVLIRDVRCIHRGTPNRTGEPRPMVVIGYSRRWLHRPEVGIRIPRSVWEALPEESRHLLRFSTVVDHLATAEEEVYRAFSY